MSGSFYSLTADERKRRLVFSMGRSLRIGLALAWVSLCLALVPALVPQSGIVIAGEGWISAGLLWALSTLGVGWVDRWVLDAKGEFHRERGWLFLRHRQSRSLKGFEGWIVESYTVRMPDPLGRRASLDFKTEQGRWRIDSRFRAEWLDRQMPLLGLWVGWLGEGARND